jgi:hypothetical protein
MYTFVAGLLLMAALAVAPGVGGFLHQSQASLAVAPSTSASADPGRTPVSQDPAPVTHQPSPSVTPSARKLAVGLVDRYEAALVAGTWSAAFDLLAATSLTREAGLESFMSERAAFFDSVDGRYTIGDPERVRDWTAYGPLVTGAVRSRAWLVEVDYPALSNNNAGYEQFVVAPDSSGAWRIWPVR